VTLHLEGMGWFGAATAFALERVGVSFTWNDTDAEVRAWPASTGMVYPAGDERSARNLDLWWNWYESKLFPAGMVRPVSYVYTHKRPPHEGRYRQDDLGPYRVGHRAGIAVDVPAIVTAARLRFVARRIDRARPGHRVLVTHGFGDRCGALRWGWSREVQLDVPDALQALPNRAAFYSRRGRFQIVYAYVIPTRPGWWWAGSSLVAQAKDKPRRLDAGKHFDRWLDAWRELWPGVPVIGVGELTQGWRPVPVEGDTGTLDMRSVPPLWHSGVRWAPEIVDRLVEVERRRG
jgi:hypothetical protein